MSQTSRATSTAFDRGAGRYDIMVGLNPGYHRHLRFAAAELVRRLGPSGPLHTIDLACGTGASTRALVAAAPAGSQVLGLDASAGMLDRARAKEWPPGVRFEQATSGRLNLGSLSPGSWDGILSCYLFRNVAADERDRALAEAYRLLRPGGWLVAQDYSVAGDPLAARAWDAACWGIIIPLGVIVDRNPGLYRYLWRSVRAFDSTRGFADRLAAAGFVDIATRTVPGWQRGILHTFVARKPEER